MQDLLILCFVIIPWGKDPGRTDERSWMSEPLGDMNKPVAAREWLHNKRTRMACVEGGRGEGSMATARIPHQPSLLKSGEVSFDGLQPGLPCDLPNYE